IGYGAAEHITGYGKHDPLGAVPAQPIMSVGSEGYAVVDKGKRPSEFGFGTLIETPSATAYTCETILRTATVSTRAVAAQITAPAESLAVLADLALLTALNTASGAFYRSGTDLLPAGPDAIRAHRLESDGSRTEVDVADLVSETADRLAAATSGGFFAEPVTDLVLGEPALALLARRIIADATGKE